MENYSPMLDVCYGKEIVFVDIESHDKNVAHCHNVAKPDLPESMEVNRRMMDFMLER